MKSQLGKICIEDFGDINKLFNNGLQTKQKLMDFFDRKVQKINNNSQLKSNINENNDINNNSLDQTNEDEIIYNNFSDFLQKDDEIIYNNIPDFL